MTTGHVFIATSLDGYVARSSGELDWLMKQKTDGEDLGYDEFIASVDGLIMGRGSYLQVLGFEEWSYSKPVMVMSKTLTPNDVPSELKDKVTLTNQEPHELMAAVEELGWKRAYVDGGKVVQSFMRAGLIEDLWLTRVPILIGEGIPLFGSLDRDIDLEHFETRSFASGLVSSRYRVVR